MFRWLSSVVVLSGLFLGVTLAQTPGLAIKGETNYPPHSLVRLQADGVDAKAGLVWRVYPNTGVQRATTPKGVLEFAAPAGTYEVELLAITQDADGGIQVQEARVTLTLASCHPQPPPTPPDPPKPLPPSGKGTLDPANAIGRIAFANAGCSATVIGPRRADGRWDILTAAHCNSNVGQTGTITMPKSGKVYKVRVTAHNTTADICWMVTESSIDDIEYANLSKDVPPVGTEVWHQGYGIDRPRNLEKGKLTGPTDGNGQLRFTLNVSSGDSGGGIFRKDTNEVIATVCCTMGKGALTSMWGGGCLKAWEMRNKLAAEEDQSSRQNWTPTEIPLVIEFPVGN